MVAACNEVLYKACAYDGIIWYTGGATATDRSYGLSVGVGCMTDMRPAAGLFLHAMSFEMPCWQG